MARHNDFGRWGEQKAADYLVGKGYRILERNWRIDRSELDIIAMDGDCLVFVEVKTRQRNYLVAPELAIDRKKMLSICHAANVYIKLNRLDFQPRFDIVTIVGTEAQGFEVNHIPDAFIYPYR